MAYMTSVIAAMAATIPSTKANSPLRIAVSSPSSLAPLMIKKTSSIGISGSTLPKELNCLHESHRTIVGTQVLGALTVYVYVRQVGILDAHAPPPTRFLVVRHSPKHELT